MMKKIIKISFLVVFNIAIIGSVNVSEALIPLPTLDIRRIQANIQNTMHAIEQIKMEIESNIRIIQEIQHGGYMAAAGALFGKIQNGDYDRFGQNLMLVRDSTIDTADEFATAKMQNKRMKELQAEGKTRAEAKEIAAKEAAAKEMEKQMARRQKAYEKSLDKAVKHRAKELMKEEGLSEAEATARAKSEFKGKTPEQIALINQSNSKLNNTYRWLQNGRVMTSAGLDAIEFGMDGDWQRAFVAAGTSVGDGFFQAGDRDFGVMIGAGSAAVGSVWDAVDSKNINEAYGDLKRSYGGVVDNAADMGVAYQNYLDDKGAAEDAAAGK